MFPFLPLKIMWLYNDQILSTYMLFFILKKLIPVA